MLKALKKIAKFIILAYAAIFMLILGMIVMTNMMISGLQ